MAGRRIDQLFYDITARTQGLERGLASSQRSMRGFVGKIGLGTAAVTAFGAAAIAAGIKATRMAASLDSALREVSTLLPGTVENVSRLREEVVALSTEVPQTPELLTRGLYQVISAGISDTAEAMDVLRVSAQAAVAGLTDTFTSVDAITTVLNAYQLETSEAARVSDVFFAAIREGKLTFTDIAANIGNVATSAALAGVSIEEVGAAMATLTKFGIGTAEATTSLNRLFLSLTNVTDEAAAAAESMGIELSTAALRSKGLVGFLQDLERATGGNIDKLAELIPEIRAARGVFVLAGQGADEYRRVLDATNDATGLTAEANAKLTGSLENQVTLLKNRVNAAWLELGATILPTVLDALRLINRLLESDAEALSRAYETLGLTQEAAAVLIAAKRQEIVESLQETRSEIDREIAGIAEDARRIGAGIPTLTEFDAPTAQALFPPELASLQERSARAQREILDATIETARARAAEGDLSAHQAQVLGNIVAERQRLIGQLDQQIRGEEELLRLATARGDVETETEPPEPPDVAPTLTEAERKALDLRDALLSADAVLRDMGESGADLLSEVPNVIADLQAQLDDLASGLDADFDDFSLDARLLSAQRAIEGVTRSGASFGQQALAVQGILDQWGIEVDQLPPGFRAVVQAILDVGDEAEDVSRELRDIIQDVSFAARGAVELANAFGLVGDEAAAVVNQISLIGEGIGRIASGDILSGIGGVASGLAGIVGGLFGGGPSEEELARQESLRENTRRIEELNDRLSILGDILRGLPGQMSDRIADALQGPLSDLASGSADNFLSRQVAEAETALDIGRALRDAGVSVSDIQQAASALGVDADQLVRLLQGEDLEFAELREATQQAETLFDLLDTGLADVLDTVRGRLGLLQDAFDVLDIDDPAEQLRLIAEELGRAGTALSAADIERLATGDEEFIEELFRQLQAGSGRFTDIGAFGELSFDEFLDILRQMEGIQDRIADGVEGEEGDFQNVSAINRLTVEQGDTLIALQGTANFYLREIRDSIGSPVQVTDRMLAAAGTVRVEGTVVHDVRFSGGDASGLTDEQLATLGSAIRGTALADQDMGAELRRMRAGLGLPPVREQ